MKQFKSRNVFVSAGDAITARLIKEAGFDGIWVSGFEVTARMGLKDDGRITMTEMISHTHPICQAVDIPVFVDVDTGYQNFERTVFEFQRIGASGVCVEDNLANKENSLFGGKRNLLKAEEFAKKINIKTRKIKIIARTESLIRGMGLNEALRRGRIYQDAGADALLIHSRDVTGNEACLIPKAAKKCGITVPLVIVPTKFPHMTSSILADLGYSVIIWANQTERVKIKAIRESLTLMKSFDNALFIEKSFGCTLEDLRGLVP